MDEHVERLSSKLAPESVRLTLIRAGCFLAVYELIKSEIIDGVRGFYCNGIVDGQITYDERSYEHDVARLNPKSRYQASCEWLVGMDAISQQQVDLLGDIYRHRKVIAHELPRFLIDPDFDVRIDLLVGATECVRSLGVFWGTISVQTDPFWQDEDIDYSRIKSGSFILMEYLTELAELEPPVVIDDQR